MVAVKDFPEARIPADKMVIAFGSLGQKKISARLAISTVKKSCRTTRSSLSII